MEYRDAARGIHQRGDSRGQQEARDVAQRDDRAQRRSDRQADRTGDAELEEYNARLQALADRDTRARR